MDTNLVSDSHYNLLKTITKRFKAEADSTYGLIIVNEEDFKVLFINNALLGFLNKQWLDIVSEPISTLLTLDDYDKLTQAIHKNKQNTLFNKLLNREWRFTFGTVELMSQDVRSTLTLEHTCIHINNESYNLIYGLTTNPINNFKCTASTPLDPWINSFTKLMYIITDDYSRFWLFILGIVVSIFIADVTLYINKPPFICAPFNKTVDSSPKLLTPK